MQDPLLRIFTVNMRLRHVRRIKPLYLISFGPGPHAFRFLFRFILFYFAPLVSRVTFQVLLPLIV